MACLKRNSSLDSFLSEDFLFCWTLRVICVVVTFAPIYVYIFSTALNNFQFKSLQQNESTRESVSVIIACYKTLIANNKCMHDYISR